MEKRGESSLERAVMVLLSFVIATGRCPICEHKLGNQKTRCHCECHDEREPWIDPVLAESYVEAFYNRQRS